MNRINHPGLVQISDFGQLPDKTAYIVMEYLAGESLGARLKQRSGALELGQVLNLGCQLAESLAAAHEKGIIHRDLKPDNVMVVADSQMPGGERTKLLDFGIAKLLEEGGGGGGNGEIKTRTNSMMGTPYYMSPEQCRGADKVDDRADVYSFGVMMYEMLSGERPFIGEGQGDLVVKQMTEEPPPLLSKAPHVPEQVAELVHRMLIKDKLKRPSMAEVVSELLMLQELAPSPSRRSLSGMKLPGSLRTSGTLRSLGTATAAGQSGKLRMKRRSLGLTAGAVVLVGGLAVLGIRPLLAPKPHVVPPPPIAAPKELPPKEPPAPAPAPPPPQVAPPPAAPVSVKKGKPVKRTTPSGPRTGTASSSKKPPSKREIEE